MASGEAVNIFSSMLDGIRSGVRGVTVGRGCDSASAMLRASGEPTSPIGCSTTGVVGAAGFGGSAWCQELVVGTWSRFADTGVTGSPVGIGWLAGGVVMRVVEAVEVVGAADIGFVAIGVEAMTAGCETMAGCVVGACDIGCVGIGELITGEDGAVTAFMSLEGLTRGW